MRNTKRIASLLLALVMVFAMAISVSADQTEIDAGTGSILIQNNDTVKASEKTFKAFKILDLKAYWNENKDDVALYEYTVPAGMEDFYANRYHLTELEVGSVEFLAGVTAGIDAETDLYAFARDAINAAKQAGIAPASGEAVEGTGYQFSNLPLGYYAIEDTTGASDIPVSAIVLTSGTPDVKIEVKADLPKIEKEIDDDNDLTTSEDRVQINDAAIGDTITYVLSSNVPSHMEGYDKYFFIMKDHMSEGLTYNNNMVITIGTKTLVENTDYILTVVNNEDGTTDLKIVFVNFIQYNTTEFLGKPVQVTYTAILNEKAVLNPLPNTNDVYLEYSNNPEVDYAGDNEPGDDGDEEDEDKNLPPLGETPKEEVETHTTGLQIIKTDVEGNPLTGAEFTLTGNAMNVVRLKKGVFVADDNGAYWKLNDGTYTTTDPNGSIDGQPVDQTKYESLTDKYTLTTETTTQTKDAGTISITATVGDDGILRFEGLPTGTYTIKETKAPEGFNILNDTLEVTIEWDADAQEPGFTFTGEGFSETEDHIGSITVVNRRGNEMPETGGIGTTVFYVVGGVLLLAALVLLVTRKRMGGAA